MRRFVRLSVLIAVAAALGGAMVAGPATVSPATVSGQEATATATPTESGASTGRIVFGSIPPSGFGLIVWGGGTTEQLVAASNCTEARLAFWATSGGEFITYVPAATVGAVNAAFLELFPGTIPPSTPLIAQCPRGVPAQVQTVIDMVLGRRIDDLENAVRLSAVPCGPQQGPGSPPACPAGAPTGTPVEIFPVVTCEGELRPRVAVAGTLEQTVPTIVQLTGVYRAPQASLHYLPVTPVPGDHVAVFSRQVAGQSNLGVGFVIAGSELVGLVFGCGADPTQIVPPGTEAVFLPGG